MRGTVAVLLACCTLLAGCVRHTLFVDGSSLAKAVEESGLGVRQFAPDDPLLHRRVVFMQGPLSLSSAHTICQQLVYLDSRPAGRPIKLLINSGGGDGMAYWSIRNTIRGIETPVDTVNIGFCASAASLLFQSATGKRYAVERSIFGLHEPRGEPEEWVEVLCKHQEELLRSRCRLPEEWFPMRDRELTFSAEEALQYGFVDAVLQEIDL